MPAGLTRRKTALALPGLSTSTSVRICRTIRPNSIGTRTASGYQDQAPRGDLVFFRENGLDNQITHVAMYSGNGYVLHASAYYAYQQVVESKMENIEGYAGARRIRNID